MARTKTTKTAFTPEQSLKLEALLNLCATLGGEASALAGELRASMKGTTFNRYSSPITENDTVYTREEFLDLVGIDFMGADGFAYPAKDGMLDGKTLINPDDLNNPDEPNNLPEDATHLVWISSPREG